MFLCEEDGPWVTKELKAIVKKGKWVYEYKMEEKFSYVKLRSAWRGLKRMAVVISSHQQPLCPPPGSMPSSFPNHLHFFYSRFETNLETPHHLGRG